MATDNALNFEMTADALGTIIRLFDPAGKPLPGPEVIDPLNPPPPPAPVQKRDKLGNPIFDEDGKPLLEAAPVLPLHAEPKQKIDSAGKPVVDAEGKPVFEASPSTAPAKPVLPVWALKDPEGTVKMTVAKDGMSAKFDPTGVLTDVKPAEVSTRLATVPPQIGHFFITVKPGKSFSYVMNKA
jgi:hypothetical protein